MTLQHIADVDKPEIGRFYLTPMVYGYWLRYSRWWPVLGTWHEDMKIIGFPKHHYHIDARFVSALHIREYGVPVLKEFELPLQNWDETENKILYPGQPRTQSLARPELRRRRYRRHMPDYPRDSAPWMTRLECAYKNHTLKPELVCPHRGAPLRGLVPDSDGCVTCPLHGLRWNLATGKMQSLKQDCVDYYATTTLPPLRAEA